MTGSARSGEEWGGEDLRQGAQDPRPHPKHVVVLYKFCNKSNLDTIVAERERLLTQARDAEALKLMDDFKWDRMPIP